VLEGLDILLRIEAVALGIPLGLDELRKFVRPETHKRDILAKDFGNFADCVQILFHINP
jgi:hypothetical protein